MKASQGSESGYRRFKQDPQLTEFVKLLRASGMKLSEVQSSSGVTTGTIARWRDGKTRRPQNITLEFALRALGYQRICIRMEDVAKINSKPAIRRIK